DVEHLEPNLLARFAPDGGDDVLARLDETGECRIHALGKARLVRQHAALAVGDQHYHDRIEAWERDVRAGGAGALPATIRWAGGSSAPSAAAVVLMPMMQRFGL